MKETKQSPAVAVSEYEEYEADGDVRHNKTSIHGFKKPKELGEPGQGKSAWHVQVSHTTLLFKSAKVWAASKDEARRVFLDAVKDEHERIANKERAQDPRTVDKQRAKIRGLFDHGVKETPKANWIIQPWDKFERQHKSLRLRMDRVISLEQRLSELNKVAKV